MRTVLLIILAIMSFGSSQAQPDGVASESTVITGVITFDALQSDPRCGWFQEGVAEYAPDPQTITALSQLLPEFDVVVFMGTWCSDSQRLIPQLYKTLQLANYPLNQVVIYGLDEAKQSADGVHETHLVEWVPTIILKQYGSEVGRITENVQHSVEADLLAICKS